MSLYTDNAICNTGIIWEDIRNPRFIYGVDIDLETMLRCKIQDTSLQVGGRLGYPCMIVLTPLEREINQGTGFEICQSCLPSPPPPVSSLPPQVNADMSITGMLSLRRTCTRDLAVLLRGCNDLGPPVGCRSL